jgi:hypothetical protein
MKFLISHVLIVAGVFATFAVTGLNPVSAQLLLDPVSDYYLIETDYDKNQAYPGNRNLYLKVTMKTPVGVTVPADKVLKPAKFDIPDSKMDISDPSRESARVKDNNYEEVYSVHIFIPPGTDPRTYRGKLKFQYPNGSTEARSVDLNVGWRTNGKLKVEETEHEPLVAGQDGVLEIRLVNEYPDYVVNLRRISVSSLPSGLIRGLEVPNVNDSKAEVSGNTINFKPPLSFIPSQVISVPLNVKARPMSVSNWIAGFGDKSKLRLSFEYDDSNGRIITDFIHETPIKVRPGDGSLLIAMIIGVLIGTGLKFYLEYLRRRGVINKKGVAVFILITAVVGIVITIIAWAGQIQIIAFKDINLSYDRPVVIFIIGLIGALAGVHYLNNWAKKLLPPDPDDEKEAEHA